MSVDQIDCERSTCSISSLVTNVHVGVTSSVAAHHHQLFCTASVQYLILQFAQLLIYVNEYHVEEVISIHDVCVVQLIDSKSSL